MAGDEAGNQSIIGEINTLVSFYILLLHVHVMIMNIVYSVKMIILLKLP